MKEQNTCIKPIYKADIPAIIFTIDDGYVPYFSVALAGLLHNTSDNNVYDITVLYKFISEKNMEILQNQCRPYPNVSLRFFNVGNIIAENQKDKLVSNIEHINEVAFYRLYIPDIFALYKKIIFLDADICIDGDVAGLYRVDLGKNYLGAVRGCMAMQIKSYSTCISESAYRFARYVHDVVHMDGQNYFNAGVLLFNVRQMLKDGKNKEFLSKLDIVKTLRYNDQDILNMCCKDRVKYLGCEWNYCAKFENASDKKIYDDMLQDSIKIYHYIGSDKPWINKFRPFYNVFYTYAMLSPYWKNFLKN